MDFLVPNMAFRVSISNYFPESIEGSIHRNGAKVSEQERMAHRDPSQHRKCMESRTETRIRTEETGRIKKTDLGQTRTE